MPVIWASRNIISGIRVFRSPLPPTSPSRARRPYCARLFIDDWIVAAPTVSIITLAPWSAVRAIIISAKSSSPVSITWSAPNAVRDGAFWGDDVTARARAPRAAAGWTAWTPSPPPAPVMATVSPGARAVAVRACRATPAGQARRADWVRGRASGRRIRLCWERAMYSANPPSRAWPMPGPRRQRCWRPGARQRSHWPQALVSSATTRSPGWTRWTPGAVSSDDAGDFVAQGYARAGTPQRRAPAITRRSWWQKPQAAIRHQGFAGGGDGFGAFRDGQAGRVAGGL